MGKPLISKKKQKKIAGENIDRFFELAEEKFSSNKGLSNRYVTLARKTAMKVKIRMPRQYKRRYCKHCYKYLRTGINSKIRVNNGKVIISCYECNKFSRIPLK